MNVCPNCIVVQFNFSFRLVVCFNCELIVMALSINWSGNAFTKIAISILVHELGWNDIMCVCNLRLGIETIKKKDARKYNFRNLKGWLNVWEWWTVRFLMFFVWRFCKKSDSMTLSSFGSMYQFNVETINAFGIVEGLGVSTLQWIAGNGLSSRLYMPPAR